MKMFTSRANLSYESSLIVLTLGLFAVCMGGHGAKAQSIRADGTVGTTVMTGDNLNFTITDGTTLNNNLFHSFEAFSIPTGGSGVFSNNPAIANIFSRVTGSDASNIDGLLQTTGTTNLYFINPNGITFGSSAALNIGGSFTASTADAISFGGSANLFSATNPTNPALLTITAPIGLQFGSATPAPITVQGATLVAAPGKTIELSGGQISLTDQTMIVAPVGSIKLSATQSLELTGESQAFVPNGDENSQITVDSPNISLLGGSQIGLLMTGVGQDKNLLVNTTNLILDGGTSNGPSALFAAAAPPGSYAGNAEINTESLTITNGAQIVNSTFGPGDAGKLTINAKDITISGFNPGGPSSIQSASDSPVGGLGGEITINTATLKVANGGQIATSTRSSSAAGNLNITATDSVELSGQVERGRSGLFANAVFGNGAGGNITLRTNLLRLTDGATINVGNALSDPNAPAFTRGTGVAGNIEVTGGNVEVLSGSLITSDGSANSAGNIKVNTGDGTSILLDQGMIKSQGGEGNIELRSPLILLRNGSLISANGVETAQGGNILTKSEFLVGLNNSDITANAQQGAGGRIVVTGYNSGLAISDVITSVSPFLPGEKGVTVLGLVVRNQLTPENDITATSELGSAFNGSVTIQASQDDIENVGTLLEKAPNDDRLLEAACRATKTDQFVAVGRGGLPMVPEGLRSNMSPWDDVRVSDQLAQLTPNDSQTLAQDAERSADTPEIITQAQGLVMGDDGRYHLVAIAPESESLLGESRMLKDTCPSS